MAHTAGDAVEARFGGGEGWFRGEVTRVRGDGHRTTYDVLYADGDSEQRVAAELVRPSAPVPLGFVLFRYSAGLLDMCLRASASAFVQVRALGSPGSKAGHVPVLPLPSGDGSGADLDQGGARGC